MPDLDSMAASVGALLKQNNIPLLWLNLHVEG